jgi:2-phosphoglycerate kinase
LAGIHTIVENPIVLLEGGTGVGTSVFSLKLAAALDIPVVVNTDCIREVLRTAIGPEVNPALTVSTYLAGRTWGFEDRTAEQQRHEIIHGFKAQCSPIQAGVDRIVRRAIKENRSVLIEGIHLEPGRIRDTEWHRKTDGRIVELFLYIDDPDVHRERFVYRQLKAPERPMGIYLENFREIRWIHDYLLERAMRCDEIFRVNNVNSASDCLDKLLEILSSVCPDRITSPVMAPVAR